MYADVLGDARLYSWLLEIDRDLAEQTREAGCRFCQAPLHSACYTRKPRGVPEGVDPEPAFDVCFSFCCSAEGCRKRHRAPSVRFLGRKVYLGVVVTLVTAMRQGPTPRTVRELTRRFGADRRTLRRWRLWWQQTFPSTPLWLAAAGRLMPPLDASSLPRALITRFTAATVLEQVLKLMKFLCGADSPF